MRQLFKKRYAFGKTKISKLADKTLRNYQNHTKAINSYESTIHTIDDRVPQDIIPQGIIPQERDPQDIIITAYHDYLQNNLSNIGNNANKPN